MLRSRLTMFALLVIAALAFVPGASAATSASGTQSVTGNPNAQLEATFPSAYAFSGFAIGSNNDSSEQTVNVKSNKNWGAKVSSDEASGKMRRWNGTAYATAGAARTLTNSLNWANTSYDGTPVGSPTYAGLSSTAALVVGGKPKTGDAGKNVGVKFRQVVNYDDDADISTDTYRVLVTYDAAQGF